MLCAWYLWGQFHPMQSLVWGASLKSATYPAGLAGAGLGALAGNAARHFRIKCDVVKSTFM